MLYKKFFKQIAKNRLTFFDLLCYSSYKFETILYLRNPREDKRAR